MHRSSLFSNVVLFTSCFFALCSAARSRHTFTFYSSSLIIYGLPETENNREQLTASVVSFLQYFLALNVSEADILFVHRMGYFNNESNSFYYRPVKVNFETAQFPTDALKVRRRLKGTQFIIARPRTVRELEESRVIHRYEKKIKEQCPNISTHVIGSVLYIEDVQHSADDILRIEQIENDTKSLNPKVVSDEDTVADISKPTLTTQSYSKQELAHNEKAILEIFHRYEAKVKKRNPQTVTEIVGDKLYVDYVPYTVDQILDKESRESAGVLTSWMYPTTSKYVPKIQDVAPDPKIWYTHKFEDLVNLNETMLRIHYNKEWTVLKRGLLRDRIGMLASNIAAGMLWTEGYPYKVEELLEKERQINATKLRNRMRRLNVTATTLIPKVAIRRKADLNKRTRRIRKEKEEYITDILTIFEAHYRALNKSTEIAGVFLWISCLPHWADQCILRYEWEQKNPGSKFRWHPKRRPISESELSSSSNSNEYVWTDYMSSSDSDYVDENDDTMSMSEKKKRRKERRKRRKPKKESQLTKEERKILNKAISNQIMGGL